jgi:homopolymeric O-antigen transport system permease protein
VVASRQTPVGANERLSPDAGAHETVLKPPGRWAGLELLDLWRYRELVYILAWRDVKVRYKQAVLGFGWTVIQPLMLMALFTFMFTRITNLTVPGNVPYPVFAFTGLLPWTLFANVVGSSAASVVANANMVSRVYFPRLTIPVGAVLARTPDFLINSVLLFAIMGIYGVALPTTALLLPVIMAASMLAAASIGIWLSALNVAYRDMVYLTPFLTQVWLFITPVAYPSSAVPASLSWLTASNPMSWVINVSRWALLGSSIPVAVTLASAGTMCIALVAGLVYFRRVEQFFADVI